MILNRHHDESGQTTVLLALVISSILMLTGLVIDGGFGFIQERNAQNAADFASVAASKLMPCSVGANSSVTGSQVQQTIQKVVNLNISGVTTAWTAQYLDSTGTAISGGSFSSTTALTPPSNACGVSVSVSGTWNSYLGQLAGYKTISAKRGAGAVGNGSQGYNLAVVSLLPYARHTIYAGAVGNFVLNGSMFDNSVAQCNNRDDTCKNYNTCLSGTPVSNITCYGDSADVFEQSTESITGTLYSVAPVALDPCFYQAPMSGSAYPMSSSSQYYNSYGCSGQFSSATNPVAYGSMQGNVAAVADPLANLPDPTSDGNASTICPGSTSVTTTTGGVFSSGSLSPGVYTTPVVIKGSVTLNPCQKSGSTTGPGIYVFQQGIEICPSANSTVTGNDVMLFGEQAPSSSYTNTNTSSNGYCTNGSGSNGASTNSIDIGGASGATVTLTGPNTGPFENIALYQDRSINENIGLDDGWTHSSYRSYTANAATITINGVVYDNSFTNESTTEVFSAIGSTYAGPYSSLCTGATDVSESGDPVPCPGVPTTYGWGGGGYGGSSVQNTSGSVAINGAVVVGAFGTQGGSTSNPLSLTITYNSNSVPSSVGGVKLIF